MGFSPTRVNRVVRGLLQPTRLRTQRQWRKAVCAHVTARRPDLAQLLTELLGVEPAHHGSLGTLSIGEIGICYEALLAQTDRNSRKNAGQYFTPDDAANFMARQSLDFPEGTWIDPACGVGNLSWHLAKVQKDSATFVARHLCLVDVDETALKTAVALIAAEYLAHGDTEGLQALIKRSVCADFLISRKLPAFDFVIANPPYARVPEMRGFSTAATKELFAYFMERIAKKARGMIIVTPSSYLATPKYRRLRAVLEKGFSGGQVFVFDNVPDTIFRGFKFGSTNTSSTNFVRVAMTVCPPTATQWLITPIIRWQSRDRGKLWTSLPHMLTPRMLGPHGEWAKLLPDTQEMWARLLTQPQTIRKLTVKKPTPYRLDVGLTPRYYISAAYRELDRGAKATLYFPDAQSMNRAAIVLNSSLPYLWWRALDGGVTLPKRVLMSTPVPEWVVDDSKLVANIHRSEMESLQVKQNAGRANENVKHSADFISQMDAVVVPSLTAELRELLYSRSMPGLLREKDRT